MNRDLWEVVSEIPVKGNCFGYAKSEVDGRILIVSCDSEEINNYYKGMNSYKSDSKKKKVEFYEFSQDDGGWVVTGNIGDRVGSNSIIFSN